MNEYERVKAVGQRWEAITPLRWPISCELPWHQQSSLSRPGYKAWDAGNASASRVERRVVREQEQIRRVARVGMAVGSVRWMKQSTGEQEGQGED